MVNRLQDRFNSVQLGLLDDSFGSPVETDVIAMQPRLLDVSPQIVDDSLVPMARPQQSTGLFSGLRSAVSGPQGLLGQIGRGLTQPGGLLSGTPEAQARLRAMGRSLMSGPTRTPVSFGRSLTEAIGAGEQAVSSLQQQRAAQQEAMRESLKSQLEMEEIALKNAEKRRELESMGKQTPEDIQKLSSVVASIDDAIKIIDEYGRAAAGIGSLTSGLPETPAYLLDATLDTVRANVGFDALQGMRDKSKTGAALGNVTVREIELLQATVAPIKSGLAPDVLRSNLVKVRNNALATAYGVVDPKTGEVRIIKSADDFKKLETGELKINYGDVGIVSNADSETTVNVSQEELDGIK